MGIQDIHGHTRINTRLDSPKRYSAIADEHFWKQIYIISFEPISKTLTSNSIHKLMLPPCEQM